MHRPSRTLAMVAALSITGLVAIPAASATPTDPPGTFTEQNLAADRTSAELFYRIPALAHLGDGVVLASWDARPGSATDAPNPNSIIQRRSTDNGRTWGPVTTIAQGFAGSATEGKYGYSDPSYVVDRQTGTVFAFFVHSKDQGFGGSRYGSDDADRNVISSVVSSSSDGGLTWSAPRSITAVVKPGSATNPQPGDVRTNFAASGEGIQLRYGAHAGRLVQQYSGMVRQTDGSEAFQAYSVYSDDHGATWKRGAFVGTGMDENKVVELSDGTVLLNSRDSGGSKWRKVARSTDGGTTWGPVTLDRNLPDPTNNASITRLFPQAAQGSPAAKKLLFTNSNSQTARENVSARVSCDDGHTWPGLRQIKPGFGAYSTATRLAEGKIGVFYEASYTNDMRFAQFDDAWLNYVCAPLTVAQSTQLTPGSPTKISVTVTNQEQAPLSGSVDVQVPSGWTSQPAAITDLAPGASTTLEVTVTAPSAASGAHAMQTVFTMADGRQSQTTLRATLPGVMGATITGARADVGRNLATNPYRTDEQVPYSFRVTNNSAFTVTVTPTAGPFVPFLPPGPGNCRWGNLPAGGSYNCTTPSHTVTADELAQGFFTADTIWQLTASGQSPRTVEVKGGEVDLVQRRPALTVTSAAAWQDTDGDRYASAGDVVEVTDTIRNTGNVTLTEAGGSDELAAGKQTTRTRRYTLIDDDVRAGEVVVGAAPVTARNGSRLVEAPGAPVRMSLSVKPGRPSMSPADPGKQRGESPVHLGVGRGQARGSTINISGTPYGQWYYVSTERGHSGDWYFPTLDGRLKVTLPSDQPFGADRIVVQDPAGTVIGFAPIVVTPRG
ncbi:exo-alpha-sialidase [Yimella sp. RIT 621]|uniref:exo-alpha-sialidase n=1 Tax=Yimella sp. RIT 621 TaxID=2510323 RepID=UPI001F110A68|nr:exo-alpha-sialidase [Yimella sp. RIT 621]